jgi:hypothetical protein
VGSVTLARHAASRVSAIAVSCAMRARSVASSMVAVTAAFAMTFVPSPAIRSRSTSPASSHNRMLRGNSARGATAWLCRNRSMVVSSG